MNYIFEVSLFNKTIIYLTPGSAAHKGRHPVHEAFKDDATLHMPLLEYATGSIPQSSSYES